jgi:hypothetical protein
MSNAAFNAAHKRVLDAMLLAIPDVSPGKIFGYPGYYVGRKLFASVIGDAVAVKLPEARVRALIAAEPDEIEPFRPMGGRTMMGWVQIRRSDAERYRGDVGILRESAAFVASAQAPTRRPLRPQRGR